MDRHASGRAAPGKRPWWWTRGHVAALVSLACLALTPFPACAGTLETAEEAIARLWPDEPVEKQRLVLTLEEQSRVREETGTALETALLIRYRVGPAHRPVAIAYLEKHRVRTLPEVLLIAVDGAGSVAEVAVLAFSEPREYQASPRWLAQLKGRDRSQPPALDRNVQGITGATLTARAGTRATRRVLAVHHLLQFREGP